MKKIVIITSFLFFCQFIFGQELPPLNFVLYDSTANSGYYFLNPFTLAPPPLQYSQPQIIMDGRGRIVYYRVFPGGIAGTTVGFRIQPNGLMSFFSPVTAWFYLMDSTFTVIDSVKAANGYSTDSHELQFLPDGSYMLLARETQIMNLTGYHWFLPGGNSPGLPNAEVSGSVIQIFNPDKSLNFQWRAHDYFEFGEVDSVWLSAPGSVDWTHSNALELDVDGNILLSSRHFNEITKINRNDGSIMWRMGGKMNEIDFMNDSIGFTGQHDIRRNPNGSLSIWDNGQYTDPPVGRALEIMLDEVNDTANVSWEYIYNPQMFSSAMGNHQILDNGNHLIDFGFIPFGNPMFVMVKPDKSLISACFSDSGIASYRAFYYPELPWELPRPEVSCVESEGNWYLVAEPGHDQYSWSNGETTQSVLIDEPGVYSVFVSLNGGYICSDFIEIEDVQNPCSFIGFSEPIYSSVPDIEVYPNPSTGEFNVKMKDFCADCRIMVYNHLGERIFDLQQSEKFNILNSGMYYLKITGNSGYVSTIKLIVIR